jgi:hypothetical protein
MGGELRRGPGVPRASSRLRTLLLRFGLLNECSEMRGDGSRDGVVLVLEALPNRGHQGSSARDPSYRWRLLENTKLQSSTSWLDRSFIFTALRTSQMSMPCLLADLMMQFWTYFWRFRQCQLNFMPFASDLHAAVAFSRATLSALDSFAASAGGRHECNAANRDGGNGNPNQIAFQVFHLCPCRSGG